MKAYRAVMTISFDGGPWLQVVRVSTDVNKFDEVETEDGIVHTIRPGTVYALRPIAVAEERAVGTNFDFKADEPLTVDAA